MPVLIAAVVLLGALCLVGLALIFAILRRLREHTAEFEKLHKLVRYSGDHFEAGDLVGKTMPAVAGFRDSRPRLVGFFSVGCDQCHLLAPDFVAAAAGGPAVAFISGHGAESDELVGTLSAGVTVLAGADADPVVDALGIRAFPTFLRVDDGGTVVRAQHTVDELAEAISA